MIGVYIYNTPKGLNSEDFLPLQFLCLDALAAPCTARCQDCPCIMQSRIIYHDQIFFENQ
jgi:hypothetical protein